MTGRQLYYYRTEIEQLSRPRFARLLSVTDRQVEHYEHGRTPIPDAIPWLLCRLPAPRRRTKYPAGPRKRALFTPWRGPRPTPWVLAVSGDETRRIST